MAVFSFSNRTIMDKIVYDSLRTLKERINKDYYELINILSRHIREYSEYIKRKQHEANSYVIANLCEELTSHVQDYINSRVNTYLPYIDELTEKELSGHNCNNCSEICNVQHSVKLLDFRTSLSKVKSTFQQLKVNVLKEYKEYSRDLKILIDEIMLLDALLNELFHIEEEHLLPGIMNAQTNIHARN